MLDIIISNKTRIKLLLKFFLNSNTVSYLRKLESEFGDSTNSIRLELNRLERSNLLTSYHTGNKKMYKANSDHPLFVDLNNILKKNIGIDRIIEKIAVKIGDLNAVYLTGKLANGIDSDNIDLVLVGKELDINYIISLVKKAEKLINRKINFTTIDSHFNLLSTSTHLLIWSTDKSTHIE